VILVTHDRYFLDQVTKWTLELDRGKGIPLRRQLFRLARKQGQAPGAGIFGKRDPQEGAHARTGMGAPVPKARQAKSKARVSRYEEMAAEAEREKQTFAQIQIPPGPRLGQNVIEFDGLKKAFGDKLLIDGLSFKLPPGGIVGIIGPNGAGKTTLFKMITGQEKPDAGTIHDRRHVKLGYIDQSRDDSSMIRRTVWEEISGGLDILEVGKKRNEIARLLSSFNFKGADQQKKVGQLSGGERNRVHLAKTLLTGANVLLLDEPTNDLDVETLQSLEAALEDFAGCAVVISHDRWFLNRLATHIWRSKATATSNGSKAISTATKRTRCAVSGRIKFQKFGR
jgi:ATPase subunit of ABC transporter with duplicated ATPase domains